MQALPPNFLRRRACRTGGIATVRTCVHPLSGNLLTAILRKLFFVKERRHKSFARQPMPRLFPPRLPVETPDNTTFIASSGGVDAYNSGLACVLYLFATHLARTLGFPGCPLTVSAHPVLIGVFTVSRRHVSLWRLQCASYGDECKPFPHVLPLRTALCEVTRLLRHPDATFSTS